MQRLLRDSLRPVLVMKFLAVFIFFLFFFASFLQRYVNNSDFWWHLATGKYIVEHGSVPQNDPFSYTSHETPSKWKSMVLKGNWLAQVIFYEVYRFWDLKGIIVLKALLMLLFLFFVFRTLKRQGVSDLPSLIVVSVVFVLSKNYLGERPLLFTFLFFSIILYLLEDFRVHRTKTIFLVPVLTLVLSNLHAGHIVCILLISLYVVGEGILSVLRKDAGERNFRTLLAVWALSMIFSLVNPVGTDVFGGALSLGQHSEGIVEFMSPFSMYRGMFKPVDYSYILFLLLSLGALRYLKKIGLTPLLVLSVFTLMSFTAIRHLIFYMCAAAPVIGRILLYAGEETIVRRPLLFLERRQGILYGITFLIGVSLVFFSIPSLASHTFRADTSFAAPKDAADFIAPLKIQGNMFNEYGIGGYLLWRLYPEKKVFIDGRSLEPDVYEEHNIMVLAKDEQGCSWEGIMSKYRFSYIIIPTLLPRGDIVPLVEELLERDDWVLIYRDHLALIFLRNTEENLPILRQFAKDKAEALDTIIIQASALATKNKANPYYLITLGKVFYKMGKRADAEKAFAMAYQRDPGNPILKKWLQKLETTK